MWQGSVVSIQIAPEASAPMVTFEEVEAVVGQGLAGDRYQKGAGTFSKSSGAGRQVTLIEVEAIEALAREYGVEVEPSACRRNIATRGAPLNHLVGKRFRVGAVLLEGARLCEPCRHLEKLTRPGVRKGLVHRGGLRADIVIGGVIRVGDAIRPEPEEQSGTP